MRRTQKTMRNSAVSLIEQTIKILLSFFSRKVFIQYLGVELLGLNSAFSSILSTLSLAELGFQQVIVFHLYGVLAKDDREQINALVNIYRLVFRCIGVFFIIASLCCLPFLQLFVSDIEVTNTVRLYFLIQALNGACTYFLAYKRNILYADQNNYISSLIDTVVHTVGTLIAMAVAVFTRNFALFLLVGLAKSYIANLFVHIVCTKQYPYLHKTKTDWTLLKKITSSLKDVVLERFAGYIYATTDNLLISMFISTIQVGFLNNYTIIFNHIKTLIKSLTTPLIPALGNKVALEHKGKQHMDVFRLLEQVYFWMTGLAVVPMYVLVDFFIHMFFGAEYVLPRAILVLLCVDMYVHINQGSCLCFLDANGLFRKRRNISIGGAITNIVVSLLLMKPFGIAGILAGTAVSQLYYWIARSVVAMRDCLNQTGKTIIFYWVKQVGLLGVVIASVLISNAITQQIFVLNGIVTFVINGLICEICFIALGLICCRGITAQRRLERIVLDMLRKVKNQKMV